MSDTPTPAQICHGSRTRLRATLTDTDGPIDVPACPGWTVGDTLAHLVGVAADLLAGNLAGIATPVWTEAHVSPRRGRSVTALLDEWDGSGPTLEAASAQFPPRSALQWAMDTITHECDIVGALGRPVTAPAVEIAAVATFFEHVLCAAADGAGLPPLAVEIDGRRIEPAAGRARCVLRTDTFTYLRAITGRRSLGQLRALDWSGDSTKYLDLFTFGPFAPAAVDIIEPGPGPTPVGG